MSSWFYGRRPVAEILKSDKAVLKLIFSETAEEHQIRPLLDLARQRKINCQRVPKKILDAVGPEDHQGVAVEVPSLASVDFKSFLENLKPGPRTFVCLLDEIQDPNNLGAILRSALCFGASGVIVPKHRSAGLTPAVMKSSSGALAYLPLVEIANLTVAVERLKEKGFWVYGADASQGSSPVNRTQFQFPLALLIGNEHRGIKPTLKKICDGLVSIPQTSQVASLNASNAAAVLFFAISQIPSRSLP